MLSWLGNCLRRFDSTEAMYTPAGLDKMHAQLVSMLKVILEALGVYRFDTDSRAMVFGWGRWRSWVGNLAEEALALQQPIIKRLRQGG